MQHFLRWIRSHSRKAACILVWPLLLGLSACGGGGGGSSVTTVANFPASLASVNDPNVTVITVEQGPGNNVNIPYVTVTVCVPGTSTCKEIDHVLLDTGSTGLRLFASTLTSTNPALTLPAHQVGTVSTVYECAAFKSGNAWGLVKDADVVIGAMRAPNVPVHLMDSNYPAGPNHPCAPAKLLTTLRVSANGILGVGLFSNDKQTYFNCNTSSTCTFPVPIDQQVQNPVALFPTENNGVIVQLPALPSSGVTKAYGYLIFGINTNTAPRQNNMLGSAKVIAVNNFRRFTTRYKDRILTDSIIDSGSNGLFFNDTALTKCDPFSAESFYCPAISAPSSAEIQLEDMSMANISFSVANANSLFQTNAYAHSNLSGTLDDTTFDWGLPFFFGRSVYTAIEGKPVGNRTGPFYAFTN